MSCLSGTYDPDVGVVIQVAIVPAGHLKQLRAETAADEPARVTVAAVSGLIDTGADATCISPGLVQQVGLTPSGKINTVGVTGSSPMNQYTVDLLLRFGPETIVIENLVVTEFNIQSPQFDVLIGRDIICRGVLTMAFNGQFTFSI